MRFPVTTEKLRKSERLVAMLSAPETGAEGYDALLDRAVSGCRAVPWVLQREIAINVPGLLPWYEARTRDMELPHNSAVVWLRDARNLATTQESPKVDAAAYFQNAHVARLPSDTALEVTNRGEVLRVTKDAEGKETRQPAPGFDGTVSMRHRIVRPEPPCPLLLEGRDISGLDATETLREYVDFLRRLVEAAERAKV